MSNPRSPKTEVVMLQAENCLICILLRFDLYQRRQQNKTSTVRKGSHPKMRKRMSIPRFDLSSEPIKSNVEGLNALQAGALWVGFVPSAGSAKWKELLTTTNESVTFALQRLVQDLRCLKAYEKKSSAGCAIIPSHV